jgi:hypothetical protein
MHSAESSSFAKPDVTAELFLAFSRDRLQLLASRIADCLGRLSDEQIWTRGSENENSVGNLVLHLCGNLRQWAVCAIRAVPDIRDRDAEFAARGGCGRQELKDRIAATVAEAVQAIATLPASRLPERIAVQNQDKTILEAIYTAVEHFAQHTGQIIFAAKMLTGEDLGYYRHLNKRPAAGG